MWIVSPSTRKTWVSGACTLSKSISVTRSDSLWIWPVKQSFVSSVTTEPGSTSSTASMSGSNAQTTSSRPTW
jgi:hypothetical protein